MRLLTDEREWDGGKTAVAFGTFDGVHLGHQKLMAAAVQKSNEYGLCSMAYSYSTHPMLAFNPDRVPLQLETLEEKVQSIARTGIEAAVLRPFDKTYAGQSPRLFVERIASALHPRFVIIGYNYSFGARGSGKAEDMQRLGKELGFETIVVDEVSVDGAAVSSTRIREAVLGGDVELAEKLLGRPYVVSGPVVEGRHIGTGIGFATANLALPEGKAIPKEGVYAASVHLNGRVYGAAVNVGDHPTLPGGASCIEAHLVGYDGGPLYGEKIEVHFLKRLRDERRFETSEALSDAIRKDLQQLQGLNGVYGIRAD